MVEIIGFKDEPFTLLSHSREQAVYFHVLGGLLAQHPIHQLKCWAFFRGVAAQHRIVTMGLRPRKKASSDRLERHPHPHGVADRRTQV